MTDLRPRDRALLELARSAHEPSEADRRRLRLALSAKLGASAGLAGAGAAAYGSAEAGGTAAIVPKAADATNAAAASTSNLGGSAAGSTLAAAGAATSAAALPAALVTKIVAGVLVAAGVGAGATALYEDIWARPPTAVHTVSSVPPVVNGESRLSDAQDQDPIVTHPERPPPFVGSKQPSRGKLTTNADARSTGVAQPKAGAVRNPGRSPRITRNRAAESAAGTASNTGVPALMRAERATARRAEIVPAIAALESEIELLSAGISARRRGRPDRAIEIFEEHRRRYPSGTLADEREVERIITLSILGRHNEARLAAKAFVAAKPDSPLAARLREALGAGSNR